MAEITATGGMLKTRGNVMEKKKIRMGVVGVGGISASHIRGIIASPDAELAALCDVKKDVLKTKSALYGMPEDRTFEKYGDLFDSGLVDAVSICTPNNVHVEIAMAAAAKGIPFALEKPAGVNDEEVKKLFQKTVKEKLGHMICFSYRFKAAARYARNIIGNGLIGKIHHVYGQYLQGYGLVPDRPLVWRYQKEIAGGGADADLGCHLMDLVTFMTGLDYESVCAQAGNFIKKRKDLATQKMKDVTTEDFCHILAEFDSGASAVFSISKCCTGRGNYQRIEIYGDKGSIVYSLEAKDTIEVCIGEPYARNLNFSSLNIPAEFQSDQMQSFFNIVNNCGDGLAANLTDGYRAQQLITRVTESFETGKWIKVPKKTVIAEK